jgi:phenylacetic acid degradation operon negative regulatory protein
VFVTIYDGLAGHAETHVRAVVTGFADTPDPGIRAHTTAQLVAAAPASATGKPESPGSGAQARVDTVGSRR